MEKLQQYRDWGLQMDGSVSAHIGKVQGIEHEQVETPVSDWEEWRIKQENDFRI